MKKLIFILFFIFLRLNAQIGIGTSKPDASAILDVSSTNKGLLLPSVSLSGNNDTSTIPSPANGLMVYNTTAAGSGANAVAANSVYFWNSNSNLWSRIYSRADIKAAKIPLDFVLSSKNEQRITDNIAVADLNNASKVTVVTWVPSDILIQSQYVQPLSGQNSVKVLDTGKYQISGVLSFYPSVSGAQPTVIEVAVQSSSDGVSWTDVSGTTMALEQNATNQYSSIIFPTVIHQFNAGDILRMVFSTPVGNLQSGSGIAVRNTSSDITKTFKFTRIIE